MKRGALILAGGQSRRMGRAKAWLPLGDETLLQRIERILAAVTDVRIVVAATEQDLPPLPPDVRITRDERPGKGPLEGILAGLRAGEALAEAFYVSSCDVPLLKPDFVRHLFSLLDDDTDIVVPRDEAHFHPLAAVYHRRILPQVEGLLAADRRRPFFLFEQVRTRVINTEDLHAVDAKLESLENLNTPADYEAVRRKLGLA